MKPDPRVTPTAPTVGTAAGQQANAGLGQLTREQLGMEVANELGIDPHSVGASGLTAAKIDQYEAQTHSGTQNGNNR